MMDEKPGSSAWFQQLRFDPNFHLGLGDIRLTPATQDDVALGVSALEAELAGLRAALQEIADLESSTCPACQGSGARYADGKAHYPSEGAPTVACDRCGGTGQIASEDAATIAAEALLQEQDKEQK